MTHDDHIKASVALINWFQSQEIDPADAQCIMSLVIARQIANKCKTVAQMKKIVEVSIDLLVTHIAEELVGD